MGNPYDQTITDEERLRRILSGKVLPPDQSRVTAPPLYTAEELAQLKKYPKTQSNERLEFVGEDPESNNISTNILESKPVIVRTDAPEPSGKPTEAQQTLNNLRQQNASTPTPDLSGIPMTLNMTSGSRTTRQGATVTPGLYTPEQGAQIAARYREQAEAEEKASGINYGLKPSSLAEQIGIAEPVNKVINVLGLDKELPAPEGTKLNVAQKAIDNIRRSEEANNKMLAESKALKEKFGPQVDQANQNLRNIEERINNSQIDPNHYWTQGLTGAQGAVFGMIKAVGTAIANAFGAYAQGISGGRVPNTAVQIMEKAIDRDMKAQQINLQKLMAERGYAKETRDYVMNSFEKAQNNQKALEFRQLQLGIAHNTADTNKIDVRLASIKAINELEQKAVMAEAAARDKVVTSTTTSYTGGSHQVLNPMFNAALKQPKEGPQPQGKLGEEVRRSVETVKDVDSLTKKMDEVAPSRFAFMNKLNTDKAAFEREKLYVMQNYRKAMTGAAFSEKESAEYMKLFDSNTWVGWNAAKQFLQTKLRQNYVDRALRALQQDPRLVKSLLPSDYEMLGRRGGISNPPVGGKPAE